MEEITTSYNEGNTQAVKMHDGTMINLHKLANDWDYSDRRSAMNAMQNARERGELLTGLLYMNDEGRSYTI